MKPRPTTALAWGVVSPNGWAMPDGAAAFPAIPETMVSISGVSIPVQRVSEGGVLWERWKKEPRLRRASPVSRFIAQSVSQAMEGAEPGKRRGLIGVFSTGAIAYSRRFYEGVLKQGRSLASPALFPETVYNSPLSHTAALFGFDGPAYSLVGDESAWVAACETAELWIALGTVEEVVVVAAEELDAISVEAFHAAGWLRKGSGPGRGFVPAEGAVAVRLGAAEGSRPHLAVSSSLIPFTGPAGFRVAAAKMGALLPTGGGTMETARGLWSEPMAREVVEAGGRSFLAGEAGYSTLGRSFSVSAGWATVAALRQLGPEMGVIHVPVFGANHAVAALTVTEG